MSTAPFTSEVARSGRGRRVKRTSGDERERAILETAERLLEERSLGEISVDDLARGAGISRPAFYFYFPSKVAVVLTLIDRLVEAADLAREATDRVVTDPMSAWRVRAETFYTTFGAHRAVIRAISELCATNEEARELRAQVIEGWVAYVTERIDAERERGAASEDVPARELATALVQMTERVLNAIFVGETPAVEEGRVIDVLNHIWLGAIYGTHS